MDNPKAYNTENPPQQDIIQDPVDESLQYKRAKPQEVNIDLTYDPQESIEQSDMVIGMRPSVGENLRLSPEFNNQFLPTNPHQETPLDLKIEEERKKVLLQYENDDEDAQIYSRISNIKENLNQESSQDRLDSAVTFSQNEHPMQQTLQNNLNSQGRTTNRPSDVVNFEDRSDNNDLVNIKVTEDGYTSREPEIRKEIDANLMNPTKPEEEDKQNDPNAENFYQNDNLIEPEARLV